MPRSGTARLLAVGPAGAGEAGPPACGLLSAFFGAVAASRCSNAFWVQNFDLGAIGVENRQELRLETISAPRSGSTFFVPVRAIADGSEENGYRRV